MQTIKIYTKGIHTYIKPIDADLLDKEITSDGFNVHFDDISINLKDAEIATIITTTENNESNGETIHYTIDDSDNLMRPANPLISGGEYFKNRMDLKNESALVIGSIRDWRDPISQIELDIDEEIDPTKLYFCVISLRPFFKHLGIMGVVYGDLDDRQKEQLFSGEFYDPRSIQQMFPQVKVASVEYDMNVDKWFYELYAGKIYNHQGQYSFIQTTESIHVDFEDYEKAVSPENV
jgi:hypothetical protein